MTNHVPVLLKEAIHYLNIQPNGNYVDATFGGGGYTRAILARNEPDGRVLAIDLNRQAFIDARKKDGAAAEAGTNKPAASAVSRDGSRPRDNDTGREPPTASGFGGALDTDRFIPVQGNFADIAEIVEAERRRLEAVEADTDTDKHTEFEISGIVFDVGLSSDLLERSGRGFSFQQDEPLYMNYELGIRNQGKTGVGVVNEYSRDELEEIFKEYGEIRKARAIAEGIAKARKKERIETTTDLRKAVEQALKSATPKILAQVWQALRIEVNDELENLRKGLAGAWEVLDAGGRIVVVSFHSLEDRIVKRFFREKARKNESGIRNQESGKILTKKPVRPSEEEVGRNSRARSARLRCAEKLDESAN